MILDQKKGFLSENRWITEDKNLLFHFQKLKNLKSDVFITYCHAAFLEDSVPLYDFPQKFLRILKIPPYGR